MAAKWNERQPLWLFEENEGKRSMDSSKRYTVDIVTTQYESRSDDPTQKRPGS